MQYENLEIPATYVCSRCRKPGLKLWRQYNTFTDSLQLTCWRCADPEAVVDEEGRIKNMAETVWPPTSSKHWSDQLTDRIGKSGSLVPAVPTEDEKSFWGYTSVPSRGCAWWRALPSSIGDPLRAFTLKPSEVEADAQIAAMKQRNLDDRAAYRQDTIFLVEASQSERHNLWVDYSTESDRPMNRECTVRWQQLTGELATIGTYTKRPICVSISWVRINGFIVMFYEPTSELVDWRMVKKWLADEYKHVPMWDGSRSPQCDSANFKHCINHIRDLQRAKYHADMAKSPMSDWIHPPAKKQRMPSPR